MFNFYSLTSTFTPTIFTWEFYSDFQKIKKNAFKIKIQLNILNSLLGEKDIEKKFLEIVRQYPETREILPILLAVRQCFQLVLNSDTKEVFDASKFFNKNYILTSEIEQDLLSFFRNSGLKDIFENKYVSNLNDYVFGIETGLDTNARKNRSGTLMEHIVGDFVKDFTLKSGFQWKDQATVKWMEQNWGVKVKSDKSARRFDFAVFTGEKIYLIETNFYGGGGSKLKAVAGEFAGLYRTLQQQNISLLWITDGLGWKSTLRPLEDAYNATNGNIYNISMLKDGILFNLVK
ncbi:MAG: type II restriction endonuclease [Candidatus Gracilibacteria bacterium]|nr:type II restriction endonuclease [Candidatus Gracilibacteria bacterium]